MTKHINNLHIQGRDQHCDICSKTYPFGTDMKKHISCEIVLLALCFQEMYKILLYAFQA